MQKNDRPQFMVMIEAACAVFRVDPSEALLEGYWIGLKDLPFEDIGKAIGIAIQSSKFMPRPAEIRGIGIDNPESGAIAAWPEVMKLAARSSDNHTDPIAKEAIRLMGGPKRLGQMPEADLEVWGRKEFERMYLEAADRIERGDTKQITGNRELLLLASGIAADKEMHG